MSKIPSHADVQKAREVLKEVSFEHWLHQDLFHLNWWILVLASVFPYFIWWRLVDKERFYEIFIYGLVCAIFASFLDVMGVDLLLWGYPDKIFHVIPPLLPADLVVIPVTGMLIYQYFRTWKSFTAGSFLAAAIFAYVIEPLFGLLNMFELINWKHTYSFIGFALFFLGIRLIITKLNRKVLKELQRK